jgi:hypothetical protein
LLCLSDAAKIAGASPTAFLNTRPSPAKVEGESLLGGEVIGDPEDRGIHEPKETRLAVGSELGFLTRKNVRKRTRKRTRRENAL